MAQEGPDNPNWKGGRTVTSHGYVLVKRPDHPSADTRGYVYEHRLVAEENLGRPLKDSEIVHHKNEDKTDNDWDNLEVVEGNADHYKQHGRYDPETRDPGEENPEVECGCGCGQTLKKYDDWGRPREYITGHNVGDGPPTQFRVFDYLEKNAPARRAEIVEALDMTPHQVSGALTELKNKGTVENPSYGMWELADSSG